MQLHIYVKIKVEIDQDIIGFCCLLVNNEDYL